MIFGVTYIGYNGNSGVQAMPAAEAKLRKVIEDRLGQNAKVRSASNQNVSLGSGGPCASDSPSASTGDNGEADAWLLERDAVIRSVCSSQVLLTHVHVMCLDGMFTVCRVYLYSVIVLCMDLVVY